MPKRRLMLEEQLRLRHVLQLATLSALMQSRRWEPADVAFQGGTCLHLVHGSSRFSEDLDFMVRSSLELDGIAQQVASRIDMGPALPGDMRVSVRPGRDGRNPHAFDVVLSGENVVGSARVKVELWRTDPQVMQRLTIAVSTVGHPAGFSSAVPAVTASEIVADKIYALGARPRIKPRDIHDLWWLARREATPELSPDALASRLLIYPNGNACETARAWLASARAHRIALAAPAARAEVAQDLRRWLPTHEPMNEGVAGEMLRISALALDQGIAIIGDYERMLCGTSTS